MQKAEQIRDLTTRQTITTHAAAVEYMQKLNAADLLYNPEDAAADCLTEHNLKPEQISAIQHNVDQLFEIDYPAGVCPCAIAMEISGMEQEVLAAAAEI